MSQSHAPVIGFSTNVYDNPAALEPLVEKIISQFDAIEVELEDDAAERVFSADPAEYRRIAGRLRSQLEKAEFVSVHAPYLQSSTDLASPDDELRRHAIEQTLASVRFCAEIGGDRVTCHPGFVDRISSVDERILQLGKSLMELKAQADTYGVRICLENMGKGRPRYLVLSAEQHVQLANETGTSITLDLVHVATWSREREWLKNQIAAYAPVTFNVHMNDMPDGQHRHVPIGSGVLPLHFMVNELVAHGYAGPFIIDEFARPLLAESYVPSALAFAKEIRHARVNGL